MAETFNPDGTLTAETMDAIRSWPFNGETFAKDSEGGPVLVEWVDSHVATSGWQPLDEFEPVLPTVRSVGWITHQDESHLTVAPHVISAHQPSVPAQVCGVMVIPRAAIKRIVYLEVPRG